MPSSGITGWHGSLVLNFLECLHIVFIDVELDDILTNRKWEGSFLPTSLLALVVFLLIICVLISLVWCDILLFFICIFLRISDKEYVFFTHVYVFIYTRPSVCLLWGKYLFRSSSKNFLNELFVYFFVIIVKFCECFVNLGYYFFVRYEQIFLSKSPNNPAPYFLGNAKTSNLL